MRSSSCPRSPRPNAIKQHKSQCAQRRLSACDVEKLCDLRLVRVLRVQMPSRFTDRIAKRRLTHPCKSILNQSRRQFLYYLPISFRATAIPKSGLQGDLSFTRRRESIFILRGMDANLRGHDNGKVTWESPCLSGFFRCFIGLFV